ncbi:MAG TPA: hypothetical protein VFP23_05035 [Solirubrobacterales bacterium]|nr:hypothetical protein [Solirubrobacterales bacterium]
MRLAIALGLFVAVIFVGVLSGGRSGGDTAELVDHIRGALGARGVPRPLTDCMVQRLEDSLDNEKIEKLYDSPRAVRGGTTAVLANPKVERDVVKSGVACILLLEKSGRFSREELIEALRGLGQLS